MDTLLPVIGFLSLGALLIAASVLFATARRYLSGRHAEEKAQALASDLSPYRDGSERAGRERRRNEAPVIFPATINGKLIPKDRRRRGERRQPATAGGENFSVRTKIH